MKLYRHVLLKIGAIVFLTLIELSLSAKTYKLEGMVGGKYPIVIELEEFMKGLYSGRYAYKSTLQKNGNIDCSWLDINPSHENPTSVWDVRDCKIKSVETWYNVEFNGGQRLTCKMKNSKGNVYDIVAHVVQSSNESPSLIAHFKSHIGETPYEFRMFSDPSIQERFGGLMGESNFNYMESIYQTQADIEYSKGMYWSSAFVAHQCCDPATVWAYDAHCDSFYVWIRKDGRDYWWSESGSVPLKFREVVGSRF